MEYIDNEKLERLNKVINDNNIQIEWVKKIFNVNDLQDVNVWQYNYLLLVIQQVKENYGK